jgi:hypothetical protein
LPNGVLIPSSWSDNGRTLISTALEGASIASLAASNASVAFDIGALSMEGDRKGRLLLQEKYSEAQPKISPDGRWMAYTSNESGQSSLFALS